MARTVADLHSVDIRALELTDRIGNVATKRRGIGYIDCLKQCISRAPERLDNRQQDIGYTYMLNINHLIIKMSVWLFYITIQLIRVVIDHKATPIMPFGYVNITSI